MKSKLTGGSKKRGKTDPCKEEREENKKGKEINKREEGRKKNGAGERVGQNRNVQRGMKVGSGGREGRRCSKPLRSASMCKQQGVELIPAGTSRIR